jgi:hypothetical protein
MEPVAEGFDVFIKEGGKAFGAVRAVHGHGITVYVENAGDFEVPAAAIKDVFSEKVVLDPGKLSAALTEAIARAHAVEDPRIP